MRCFLSDKEEMEEGNLWDINEDDVTVAMLCYVLTDTYTDARHESI